MGSLRAVALALILTPALALAQGQPSDKDKQKAGDLVKKAIAKSQAGEHQEAADLYLEAYKIIPQPLLLSNVGSEYQQMDKSVEALGYFCKYLKEDPTGNNASYVTAQAKTLYIKLGGVDTVADSDVCKPIVKPAPVVVTPDPGQGSAVGPGPEKPPQVDEGPKTKSNPLRMVGIGVAVVGAGVFGLGVYYGLEAKKISDDITNHPMTQPWESDIHDREAEGKSAEKKQIGLMIGGGVAFAAGIAMFFIGAPKTSAEQVTITPVATPDTVGFAAAGRF